MDLTCPNLLSARSCCCSPLPSVTRPFYASNLVNDQPFVADALFYCYHIQPTYNNLNGTRSILSMLSRVWQTRHPARHSVAIMFSSPLCLSHRYAACLHITCPSCL